MSVSSGCEGKSWGFPVTVKYRRPYAITVIKDGFDAFCLFDFFIYFFYRFFVSVSCLFSLSFFQLLFLSRFATTSCLNTVKSTLHVRVFFRLLVRHVRDAGTVCTRLSVWLAALWGFRLSVMTRGCYC